MSERAPTSKDVVEIETKRDGAEPELGKVRDLSEAIQPTLVAYFGATKVSAKAFIEALMSARVTHFSDAELSDARDLAVMNDPDGARLWALVSATRLPEPLKTWVWPEAKAFVRRILGPAADLANQNADVLVELIKKRFPLRSKAKVTIEKRTFICTTRIVATWFLTKKGFEPWAMAELVGGLLCNSESSARETSVSALLRGSEKELTLVGAVGSLGARQIDHREAENAKLFDQNAGLRQDLQGRVAELGALSAKLEATGAQVRELSLEVENLSSRMQSERQHSGHRLVSAKADSANRLRNLRSLVQDALDALELHTPAPDVAAMRLRQAVSEIEGTL